MLSFSHHIKNGQCHLDKETRNAVKEKRSEPLPNRLLLFPVSRSRIPQTISRCFSLLFLGVPFITTYQNKSPTKKVSKKASSPIFPISIILHQQLIISPFLAHLHPQLEIRFCLYHILDFPPSTGSDSL